MSQSNEEWDRDLRSVVAFSRRPPLPLSDDEKRNLEAQIRSEMQAEHQRRIESLSRRKEDSRKRHEDKSEMQRNAEVSELREEMQRRFYEEQGYKRYVGSTGREQWLPPEEYEWRSRRRKRRIRGDGVTRVTPRLRVVLLYCAIALAAVVLGLLIVR